MSTILKRDSIQIVGDPAQAAAAPARGHTRGDAAAVRLVRVDGDARLVELDCPCGRSHAIELVYESAADAAQSPKEPR
ncbi:MAG: hypothetical protein EPO68_09215 [Planctomycetota bacterium]|nr:MAG: hypothetical protein EPO68_09215 [Planctomycetota bacterium]